MEHLTLKQNQFRDLLDGVFKNHEILVQELNFMSTPATKREFIQIYSEKFNIPLNQLEAQIQN